MLSKGLVHWVLSLLISSSELWLIREEQSYRKVELNTAIDHSKSGRSALSARWPHSTLHLEPSLTLVGLISLEC